MLMTVSKRFGVSCFKIKLSVTVLWIDSSSELERPQTLATNRNPGRLSVSSCRDVNHCDAFFFFFLWVMQFFLCVRDLRQPQSSWETQKEREGQIEKLQLRVIRGHRRGKADTLTSSGDLISSLAGGCHIVTLCSTRQPSRTNTPVVQCLPSINPACQMQSFRFITCIYLVRSP